VIGFVLIFLGVTRLRYGSGELNELWVLTELGLGVLFIGYSYALSQIVTLGQQIPGNAPGPEAPPADARAPEEDAPITCVTCNRIISTVECPYCSPSS